jgi:hypothetical protein
MRTIENRLMLSFDVDNEVRCLEHSCDDMNFLKNVNIDRECDIYCIDYYSIFT